MIDSINFDLLTAGGNNETIADVAKRDASSFKPAETFGAWLKYVRSLTGLTQKEAAKQARVSFDAVQRIERGKLVGSAHLLAWLAWLDVEAAHKNDDEATQEIEDEFSKWSDKAITLGHRIRDDGLAMQSPKAKTFSRRRGADKIRQIAVTKSGASRAEKRG